MDDVLDSYYNLSLSSDDYSDILKKQRVYSNEIIKEYELDNIEKIICWISGLSAGAVDAFFVTNYKNLDTDNITKVNCKSLKDSGSVNKSVDNRIKNLFSSEKISELESKFRVPYDPSTSKGLDEYVLGLNPRTHRVQSLGHDPILGFYYGVKDILKGQFTAVDNAGRVISQNVSGFDSKGINIFKAIAIQFGHLCSDISTPAGLPMPFMGQIMRLEGGDIEGFSYNRLVKNMYAKGYNFNHLLAMSVPALLIEISIRLSFFIYSMVQGKSFMEALPINKPKLDKMLFNAYLISVGCNSVKIIATNGNIFAFNPTLWMGALRYGMSDFKRSIANEKEKKRHNYIIEIYEKNINEIDESIARELKFYGK
jgi:hypothetical protein